MTVLRAFLFFGLVVHKLVWELLKRKQGAPRVQTQSERNPLTSLVKLTKVGVLGFLVFQTLFLRLLPISKRPGRLRVVGALVYLVGLVTAVIGRVQLGESWVDLEDYQVLPEQTLVSDGIYGYIRHPIYTGDILLLTGLELALNSWLVLAVVAPVLVFVRNSLREEAILSQAFSGYEDYKSRTRRFIPYIV